MCQRHLHRDGLQQVHTDLGLLCLSDGFGRSFIEYYLRIKEAEIARYQAEVTEWEQREYFDLF